MASTDGFNFKAPQFIESLSEVQMDDGADNFFDTEELVTINKKKQLDAGEKFCDSQEASDKESNSDEEMETDKDNDENVEPEKDNDENVEPEKDNDENLEPEQSFSRPWTRLQRMSVMSNETLSSKNKSKFTSVAEQLHKFHHSTPPRFKRKSVLTKAKTSKFLPTIAHSPQLRTKIRAARPSTAAPLTIQPDIKPLGKSKKKEAIKGGSIKPVPKPPTIPMPFNLTMPGNKKKLEKIAEEKNNSETTHTFKRKPMPAKKMRLEIQENRLVMKETWGVTGISTIEKPNCTTKVVPFSFEKRNQERLLEKQKKIEQMKEELNKIPAAIPKRTLRPSMAVPAASGSKKMTKENENKAT